MEVSRNRQLDLLKAVAILFVVFGHCMNGGSARTYVYTFHVPLFFVIAGITFRYDSLFKQFIVKKVKRILIPYYLVGCLSILFFKLLGRYSAAALESKKDASASILKLIKGLLYGSGMKGGLAFNSALWFLPCLFCVACFLYLFLSLMGKTYLKTKCLLLAGVIISVLLVCQYKGMKLNINWPYEIDTAVKMLPFSLVGYVIKDIYAQLEDKNRLLKGLGAVLCLIVGAFLSMKVTYINYLVDLYGELAFFYVGAMFSCIGYILLSSIVKDVPSWVEYIGRNTMIVLLFHKFPILFFQTVIPISAKALKANNIWMGITITLLATSMCLVFGWMLQSIMRGKGICL